MENHCKWSSYSHKNWKEDLDPLPNVVVFALSDDDQTMGEVLHAGASGLLGKDASPEDLITAVRLAARGQTTLAPVLAKRLVNWFCERRSPAEVLLQPLVSSLTPRERQVMMLEWQYWGSLQDPLQGR